MAEEGEAAACKTAAPSMQRHSVTSVACGPLLWGEGPPLEDLVLGEHDGPLKHLCGQAQECLLLLRAGNCAAPTRVHGSCRSAAPRCVSSRCGQTTAACCSTWRPRTQSAWCVAHGREGGASWGGKRAACAPGSLRANARLKTADTCGRPQDDAGMGKEGVDVGCAPLLSCAPVQACPPCPAPHKSR